MSNPAAKRHKRSLPLQTYAPALCRGFSRLPIRRSGSLLSPPARRRGRRRSGRVALRRPPGPPVRGRLAVGPLGRPFCATPLRSGRARPPARRRGPPAAAPSRPRPPCSAGVGRSPSPPPGRSLVPARRAPARALLRARRGAGKRRAGAPPRGGRASRSPSPAPARGFGRPAGRPTSCGVAGCADPAASSEGCTRPESGARFFENSCTRNRKSRPKRRLFSLLDNIGGIFRFCSTRNTLFSSLPERDRQPLFGVFDGK